MYWGEAGTPLAVERQSLGPTKTVNPTTEKALRAKRESRYIEFKENIDPGVPQDWCELIKDFAEIANVGGGIVVVGIEVA